MSWGWIGVDLDGTLAHSTDGQRAFGPHYIGAPVPAMVERVKQWLSEGKDVRIFTARANLGEEAIGPIQAWCHIGRELAITATKDFGMTHLYDDRAIQVQMNTGRLIE